MKSNLVACLLFGLLLSSTAWSVEIPQTPSPQPLGKIVQFTLPLLDNAKLLGDASHRRDVLVFAEPREVKIEPKAYGSWTKISNDRLLWRLQIKSPGALSINLGFGRYQMPSGGALFVYTPDKSRVIGPFTDADNETHGELWTPPLRGETVIVEVSLPAVSRDKLQLSLTHIGHDFRGFFELDKSGGCNIDVVCSEGNAWRDQISAVGAYSLGGSIFCTGALINNTNEDQTPYFLTAEHCSIDANNASSMIVFWNFQHSSCRAPGSTASGSEGDGQLEQFNSGAIWRSSYAPSDMTLVELDDPLNPDHNLFLAGWDRSGFDAETATAIHHPSGDEKRISFENDPTTITSYLNTLIPGNGTHIRVTDWDLGTTEPGSSGSPLFDQNQRIIGQLHGGDAACGNDSSDWYGRLFTSWEGGGTPSSRLRDWLDPLNTGLMALDGRDTGADFFLRTMPSSLEMCVGDTASAEVTVGATQGFTENIELIIQNTLDGVIATLDKMTVTPPDTALLRLNVAPNAASSQQTLRLQGEGRNELRTTSIPLTIFSNTPASPLLLTPANQAIQVTTQPTLQWQAGVQASQYRLEISTDAAFSQIVYHTLTDAAEHVLSKPLANETLYFWRVTALNACGEGIASSVFTFITEATPMPICRTLPTALAIPDNNVIGVTDTLVINQPGELAGLGVTIRASHTFVGDLVITLTHSESDTTATLLSRPNSGFCAGNDIDITFDDRAERDVQADCEGTSAYEAGASYRPATTLGLFQDQLLTGVWTLSIQDLAGQDLGVLEQWCLIPRFKSDGGIDPTPSTGLTVTPTTQTICQGEDAVYTINNATSSLFELASLNPPPNSDMNLTPTSLAAGAMGELQITNTEAVGSGVYSVRVNGIGGETLAAQLTLNRSLPSPALQAPVSGAILAGTASPDLSWFALTGANDYLVEIANDPSFTNIIYQTEETGSRHTVARVLPPGEYFWRVSARNDCGASVSPVLNFTLPDIQPEVCSRTVMQIPDDDANGISDVLTLDNNRILSDLQVRLNIDHSYVGDLAVTLTHENTATSTNLLTQPTNCSGDNVKLTLVDDADLSVQTDCLSSDNPVPAYLPDKPYRPALPLAVFNGQSTGGRWRLQISDNLAQDTGQLNSWCLRIASRELPQTTILPDNTDLSGLFRMSPPSSGCLPELPLLDLSQALYEGGPSILTMINALPIFQSQPLAQPAETGYLLLETASRRFAFWPHTLRTTSEAPSVSIDPTGRFRIITAEGVELIAEPAVQNACAFKTAMRTAGYTSLVVNPDGNLRLSGANVTTLSLRPEWQSLLTSTNSITGFFQNNIGCYAQMDSSAAVHTFTRENITYFQSFFSAAADPDFLVRELPALFPTIQEVNFPLQNTLQITDSLGIVYNFFLTPELSVAISQDMLTVETLEDFDADGNIDVTLHYPVGERQNLCIR